MQLLLYFKSQSLCFHSWRKYRFKNSLKMLLTFPHMPPVNLTSVCVGMCVRTSLAVARRWAAVVPSVSGICPTSAAWSHRTGPTPCRGVTWDTKHSGTSWEVSVCWTESDEGWAVCVCLLSSAAFSKSARGFDSAARCQIQLSAVFRCRGWYGNLLCVF